MTLRIKKTVCLLLAACIIGLCHSPVISAAPSEDVPSGETANIENDKYILYVDAEGCVKLYVKETGEWWYSNPTDTALVSQVSGIAKMQLNSQLIVTYIAGGSNEKQATSYASATKGGSVKVSIADDTVSVWYDFKDEKFKIPLRYSLTSDGMKAEILNSEIEETGDNQISKIALLPYWGSAGNAETGYFFVPDGSGALIDFNNGKSANGYQQTVYNTDELMNETTHITVSEKVYMPVFGIYKNTQSQLAVIEGGNTVCKLYAFVSNSNVPFNYIYPEFTFRKTSVVQMLSKTWYPLDVTFVSKKRVDSENFSVLYCPVADSDKGYSGMANTYREYLKKNGGMSAEVSEDYVPLYLDIYGSALVSDTFLGFPTKVNKSLTDFDEVKKIADEMKESGIKDINIRYKGISSVGLYNKNVPTKFGVSSKIGGKKGFNTLAEYLADNGIGFYPDEDFIYLRKSSNSLFKPSNVVQDVRQKNALFYDYDISTGTKLNSDTLKYALKPQNTLNAVEKFLKSFLKTKSRCLSVSTLSNTMISDYGSDISFGCQTQATYENAFEKLCGSDVKLMLESPYMYAAGYADCIIAAPDDSSNYDIEDRTVPFYQMVLHGIVSYSTQSLNSLPDNREAVLKAVETGSSLLYSLSATEYSQVIDDGYDELNCVYAEDWIDTAVATGNEVYSVLKDVSNSEIVNHAEIFENVFRTEYSNGTVIYVNYGDTAFETDDGVVGANDYYVCGGGQN